MKNVNADAPKWHRECETCRDEATLALSFFVDKKKYKKCQKMLNWKKAWGTVGFGARDFAHRAHAAKPKKTEFALGNHVKNTFFERNQNEFKKLEK